MLFRLVVDYYKLLLVINNRANDVEIALLVCFAYRLKGVRFNSRELSNNYVGDSIDTKKDVDIVSSRKS